MPLVKSRIREKDNEKKSTRFYSKQQEKAVAKKLNGRTTISSGSTPFDKGDVTIDNLFLVECKTKVKSSDSISIKKDWLKKNVEEAVFMGKQYSTLAFNFGPNEKNYYIIDENLFMDFVDFLKNKTED